MEPVILTFDIPGTPPLPPLHRIQCYQWGNKDAARTAFCVHGLTRNGRDFDFLAQALGNGWRVLCPDMPGRGKSDWFADTTLYNYGTYVADIAWIIGALRLSSLHWVGTSMGGIIGMMLAQMMPNVIRSMVLNDIGCLIPAEGLKRIMSYAGVKFEFASRAEAETALREICAPYGIREERHWQHLFTHSLQTQPDGRVRLSYDPAIRGSLPKMEELKDIDLWPFWEVAASFPVLLIRGDKSDLLTHQTAVEMQAKHPRLTLYEVPDTGHAPALMDDAQTSFVKNWLESLSRL